MLENKPPKKEKEYIRGKIWKIKNEGYVTSFPWPYEMKEFEHA